MYSVICVGQYGWLSTGCYYDGTNSRSAVCVIRSARCAQGDAVWTKLSIHCSGVSAFGQNLQRYTLTNCSVQPFFGKCLFIVFWVACNKNNFREYFQKKYKNSFTVAFTKSKAYLSFCNNSCKSFNRFNPANFGKLFGMAMTISALFSLLQYPMFVLVAGPMNGNPFVVSKTFHSKLVMPRI